MNHTANSLFCECSVGANNLNDEAKEVLAEAAKTTNVQVIFE